MQFEFEILVYIACKSAKNIVQYTFYRIILKNWPVSYFREREREREREKKNNTERGVLIYEFGEEARIRNTSGRTRFEKRRKGTSLSDREERCRGKEATEVSKITCFSIRLC